MVLSNVQIVPWLVQSTPSNSSPHPLQLPTELVHRHRKFGIFLLKFLNAGKSLSNLSLNRSTDDVQCQGNHR